MHTRELLRTPVDMLSALMRPFHHASFTPPRLLTSSNRARNSILPVLPDSTRLYLYCIIFIFVLYQ